MQHWRGYSAQMMGMIMVMRWKEEEGEENRDLIFPLK